MGYNIIADFTRAKWFSGNTRETGNTVFNMHANNECKSPWRLTS